MKGNKGLQVCHGPISGLPTEVVVEILVRISSLKTIALCKCVCKSWRALISDPRFTELHFARPKICLLARNAAEEETTLIPRTVFLIEGEDGRHGFHSSHCNCKRETETESCEICRSGDAPVITELKIPAGPKNLETVESTCDGLLCLYSRHRHGENLPIVVCNPVTGEFVTLPNINQADNDAIEVEVCGFGVDPNTGRYKVVMLYSLPDLKVIVHELGTDSWRDIDAPDFFIELFFLSGQAFFDGALHWVDRDERINTYGLVSFDLGSERFRYRSLPSPPLLPDGSAYHSSVAVLGGDRLCAYRSHIPGKIDVLVIDERSVSGSSSEWIAHDLSEPEAYMELCCCTKAIPGMSSFTMTQVKAP